MWSIQTGLDNLNIQCKFIINDQNKLQNYSEPCFYYKNIHKKIINFFFSLNILANVKFSKYPSNTVQINFQVLSEEGSCEIFILSVALAMFINYISESFDITYSNKLKRI